MSNNKDKTLKDGSDDMDAALILNAVELQSKAQSDAARITLRRIRRERLQLRVEACIPDEDGTAAKFAVFDIALSALAQIQHHGNVLAAEGTLEEMLRLHESDDSTTSTSCLTI